MDCIRCSERTGAIRSLLEHDKVFLRGIYFEGIDVVYGIRWYVFRVVACVHSLRDYNEVSAVHVDRNVVSAYTCE